MIHETRNLHFLLLWSEMIRCCLSDDLLHPKYRRAGEQHPRAGHCYVASEVACVVLNRRGFNFRPYRMTLPNGTSHWFLRSPELLLDLTWDQFNDYPDYSQARPCAFMTKGLSKRARILHSRVSDLIDYSETRAVSPHSPRSRRRAGRCSKPRRGGKLVQIA